MLWFTIRLTTFGSIAFMRNTTMSLQNWQMSQIAQQELTKRSPVHRKQILYGHSRVCVCTRPASNGHGHIGNSHTHTHTHRYMRAKGGVTHFKSPDAAPFLYNIWWQRATTTITISFCRAFSLNGTSDDGWRVQGKDSSCAMNQIKYNVRGALEEIGSNTPLHRI